MKRFLGVLQKIGGSLIMPIAVLPVAALLLRLGSPDFFNIGFVAHAGQAIFTNLPIIFAVGVAIGFAADNAGAAGLAAVVGYLVFTSVFQNFDKNLQTGVLGGIIIGMTAGILYNKFYKVKFPDWLAFFGGKRFIPIITGIVSIFWGVLFGYVWSSVNHVITLFGQSIIKLGAFGSFLYGFANRLLLVFGLHNVLNPIMYFEVGRYKKVINGHVHIFRGDMNRFFAGDHRAGLFMTGYFVIMMFGLPGACLAMYKKVDIDNRKKFAGLFLSIALTSMIVGVTEPIEYSFMFIAPLLYLIHAFLTGCSMAICILFGIRDGYSFSAGLIDYTLNFGLATKPLLLLPIGGVFFFIYYFIFSFFIEKFNIHTPGRGNLGNLSANEIFDNIGKNPNKIKSGDKNMYLESAKKYIAYLGGSENILEINNCITRLRMKLKNPELMQKQNLLSLGAKGVINLGHGSVQVVIGSHVEVLANEIKDVLKEDKKEMHHGLHTNICSIANGKLIPLEEVPDDVFAEKMVGDGIAIELNDNKIVAPIDGKIEKLYETKHAFMIKGKEGIEILVHVGIDTVKLKGEGFEALVKEGEEVKKGDTILKIDLEYLKENAKSIITPVIITNFDEFDDIIFSEKSNVVSGDVIVKVK